MYVEDGKPWSLNTLSKMTGKTTTKLKVMMKVGLPHTMDGNSYLFDSKVAVRWIIDHEVNLAMPMVEGVDGRMGVLEAKRRFEVARALTAELALAKEREQLANIEDIMGNVADALVNVRAKLVSMSSRLSGLLSHQDEGYIADALDTDVTEMLELLSGYTHEYIENEQVIETEDSRVNKPNFPVVPVATTKTKSR